MPFTPSHAVVALPFVRTPLVPAAIAVGAMAPDLPLFVRGLPLHYGLTHDLWWLPLTVALALALLLVWRCLLRPAVRELCPDWLAARLPESWDAPPGDALRETFTARADRRSVDDRGQVRSPSMRGALLLIASLVLGVLSHIVWDLFTHEGRWGVRVLPGLDRLWGPLAGHTWLQHGSSVVGLGIIAAWALLWLRRADRREPPRRVLPAAVRWGWWACLPVFLVLAWVIGLAMFGPLTQSWTIPHLAYRVLPPACALWGGLTLVLAVLVQVVRAPRAVRPG
ncbi:DUF4184 family protein [Microbacterium sp. zg.B48]|uniref:DUF4184 family protein n=1 Tax=Microbacterium sp. zg.B48 TaxID=2969408 RepID=UPI00214B7CD0|nr:DUF4184 family protein [Microbacterium sp. zg.B48]MCR2764889.1 DUF4184 family protein [Microbacterium sp. zg.B48]